MKPSKQHETLADLFDALGHKRRQMICSVLLQHAPHGLPFERLQAITGISASTLSHHLAKMDRGGLLRRRQKGRFTWLSMDLSRIHRLPREIGANKKGRTIGAALP